MGLAGLLIFRTQTVAKPSLWGRAQRGACDQHEPEHHGTEQRDSGSLARSQGECEFLQDLGHPREPLCVLPVHFGPKRQRRQRSELQERGPDRDPRWFVSRKWSSSNQSIFIVSLFSCHKLVSFLRGVAGWVGTSPVQVQLEPSEKLHSRGTTAVARCSLKRVTTWGAV